MLNRLMNFLGRSAVHPADSVRVPVQPVQTAPGVLEMPPPTEGDDDPLRDVPRYPPFDSGIPVTALERVLASQSDLINRIYRTAGVSREEFSERYQPAISNLARYVHLLPATDTENHSGAGGLFCFALEIGLYSLQTANASVFPVGGGVERRFHMTPKWSLATFLAGICSQLYRAVGTMVVLTRDHEQWQSLLVPIYDWATASGTDRYFIRWLEEPDLGGAQASSAFMVSLIIPPEVMQYLALDNNLVLPAMSAAITGGAAGENPILKIINPVTTRVRMEDQKRNARSYGHMTVGTHLEPHLLDAMRRLIKGGTWTWNNRSAVVWIGEDGVFINWPTAAGHVINLLVRDGYAGIPRDPDTLAEILTRSKVLETPRRGSKYWSITPPDFSEVIDTAVKLAGPAQIFPPSFDWKAHAAGALALVASPGKANGVGSSAPVIPVGPTASKSGGESKESSGPGTGAGAVMPEIPPDIGSNPNFEVDPGTGEILREEPPGYQESTPRPPENTEMSPPLSPQRGGGSGDGKRKKQGGGKPPAAAEGDPRTKPTTNADSTDVAAGEPVLPGPAADRLLAMLKKENARLLRDIFRALEQRTLKGVIASLPQGLGISHEELIGHGRPAMDFIQELAEKQWLWVDTTKPTRNLHLLEVAGKQHRMIVLKPDIALGLGFPYMV